MKSNLGLIVFILLMLFSIDTFAQGDLLIAPNRVIFEGRKQKEELNLINTGSETTTFSISFVQRKMNEDGSFTIIEQAAEGEKFADPFLRIYPRQVTLKAGEAQVVMLQYRRKQEMEDGEYRSHLYFRSEKNYEALGTKSKDTSKVVSVKLIPIFGMSIPVIIRAGDISGIATFSNLKKEIAKDGSSNLLVTLNRSGDASIYGDVKVEYVSEKGKPTVIGALKGVAVYTDINKRNIVIKLENKRNFELGKGKLKVSYTTREDAKNQIVYAESELVL